MPKTYPFLTTKVGLRLLAAGLLLFLAACGGTHEHPDDGIHQHTFQQRQ